MCLVVAEGKLDVGETWRCDTAAEVRTYEVDQAGESLYESRPDIRGVESAEPEQMGKMEWRKMDSS